MATNNPYVLQLPFDPKLSLSKKNTAYRQVCCCGLLPISPAPVNLNSFGKCCQGAGGQASHTKSLHWSYDFLLPVGTPILSACDGVVVAAVDSFVGGGTDIKYKARANYVVVRHERDGLYSRYYHLQPNSLAVKRGERIQAGTALGLSGCTGYTTGPHLHFDVVDFCIYSYARVVAVEDTIIENKKKTKGSEPTPKDNGNFTNLYSCVAQFSGALPFFDENPLVGRIQWADPPDATLNPLNNSNLINGNIAVVARCGNTDFIDKALRSENAGAIGVLIVNNSEGPELHVCATPKGYTKHKPNIPVVMVTKDDGAKLKNGQQIMMGLQKEATSKAISSSALRKEWKEVGNDKEFSKYQPVTVGPVHFCINSGNNENIEEVKHNDDDDDDDDVTLIWKDPKINELAQTHALRIHPLKGSQSA
jgi:murein DD-endopeptidase MepM/ murein hydrolase activator NlpD